MLESMPCCVECGNLTDRILTQKTSHFQINRCKRCGNFVDKCFELNTTAQFIELFLVESRVLRHFMFNVQVATKAIVFCALMLVWIKVMFTVKTSPLEAVVNSYYTSSGETNTLNVTFVRVTFTYVIIAAVEYTSYVILVQLSCCHCNASMPVLVKTIILSSYFQVFGFLTIIWNYQNYWVYEVVSNMLTVFVNIKALNILNGNKIKNLEIRVVFSKLISVAIGYFLLYHSHH